MAPQIQRNVYGNVYHAIGFLTPWEICTVNSDAQIDMNYQVIIDEEGLEHKLPLHFTAAENAPNYELEPKTRVIARRKHMFFPRFHDDREVAQFIYKNYDESEFLAGVISDECIHVNGLEYLVFFDDGHAQYVAAEDIRVVNGDPGIEHVTANIRDFYEYYFGVHRTGRRKADCKINDILRVFLNGEFRNAIVRKFYGSSLIMVQFLVGNTIEWIYEGSPRIDKVYKSVCTFLKERGNHLQFNDTKILINEERFYSVAYQNMLERSRDHHVCSAVQEGYGQEIKTYSTLQEFEKSSEREKSLKNGNQQKAPHEMAATNAKPSLCIRMERKTVPGRKKKAVRTSAHDSNQISYCDAKKAVEVLIILAEIRHEMNRAGNDKDRIELYVESSSNGREPVWKRICRFLHTQANPQNRTALKKLIQNFKNIDVEFRNTYDYYVQPNATLSQLPVDRPNHIEKDAVAIQQEVILKVQLMHKYLENRASGDKDTPNINLVQHLDEVINEFSKLIE